MRVAFICLPNGFPMMVPGISYLMTMARDAGHDVHLIDPTFVLGSSRSHILSRIEEMRPDVVCFTGTQYEMRPALRIADSIRKSDPTIRLVWGGIFATYDPDSLILQPSVDALFRGESEFSFIKYLDHIDDPSYLKDVEGLWFKDGEDVVKNMRLPFIDDLDCLPIADHRVWDMERYMHLGTTFKGTIDIEASRGCPFHCTFCHFNAMNTLYGKRHYRLRSPKKVIEEIEENYERFHPIGFRVIEFTDPLFGLDKGHLKELMALYRQRGLHRRLTFVCQSRADCITEEWVREIASAGCAVVSTGLESADDHVRRNVYRKDISKDQFKKAISLLEKYGIMHKINYIYDGPGETYQTLKAGIRYAESFDPLKHNLIMYWPLVGTDLNAMTYKEGSLKMAGPIDPPELIRKRGPIESVKVGALWISTRYRHMLQMAIKSLKLRGLRYIADTIAYPFRKENRVILLKYPKSAITLNHFLDTYLRYRLEDWREKYDRNIEKEVREKRKNKTVKNVL